MNVRDIDMNVKVSIQESDKNHERSGKSKTK